MESDKIKELLERIGFVRKSTSEYSSEYIVKKNSAFKIDIKHLENLNYSISLYFKGNYVDSKLMGNYLNQEKVIKAIGLLLFSNYLDHPTESLKSIIDLIMNEIKNA